MVADLNNDGKQDLVVANNADPPAILINQLPDAGSFLRVVLVGDSRHNRDPVGARVRVVARGDDGPIAMTRWLEIGSGYCGQSDTRLHFGLGAASEISSIEVTWPDGELDTFEGEDVRNLIDREIRIRQEAGVIDA
ncbi:MAG: ASPIC/UnbV domain-containing protein [Thermoanaerobaculia bacterium]|nr:ASPIC/UnbV domain-containing protein [Thermoanaerobaculia bacterium]